MKITYEHQNHLKVAGHSGTWYVIGDCYYAGIRLFLLEHETYGEDVPHIIVDADLNIVMEDVNDGFNDLNP